MSALNFEGSREQDKEGPERHGGGEGGWLGWAAITIAGHSRSRCGGTQGSGSGGDGQAATAAAVAAGEGQESGSVCHRHGFKSRGRGDATAMAGSSGTARLRSLSAPAMPNDEAREK